MAACPACAAVLYGATNGATVCSAALLEHWQAVVRADVGAVRQPLVDARGVEDVTTWDGQKREAGESATVGGHQSGQVPERRRFPSLAATRRGLSVRRNKWP